jgi:hypothetical protein
VFGESLHFSFAVLGTSSRLPLATPSKQLSESSLNLLVCLRAYRSGFPSVSPTQTLVSDSHSPLINRLCLVN